MEKATRAQLLDIIEDLVDEEPCFHDHHGNCQAHGWFTKGSVCVHARALAVLDAESAEQEQSDGA